MHPTIEHSGHYSTSDGHQLYWERHGTPQGEPIFFLHGGPGGYCNNKHLLFFDLNHFDVILFDQRGCGRSTPQGELTNNNTDAVVQDIDDLRHYFGFERISLLGVSWGSWLALKYQHRFKHRVRRGIAASVFVPVDEVFDTYDRILQQTLERLPEAGLTLQRTYNTLCTGTPQARQAAAMYWSKAHLGESITDEQLNAFVDHSAIASIRLELHYHLNHYFFTPADMLLRMSPRMILIQGIDDTCGMASLDWLRKRSRASVVQVRAGHNALEPTLLSKIRETLNP